MNYLFYGYNLEEMADFARINFDNYFEVDASTDAGLDYVRQLRPGNMVAPYTLIILNAENLTTQCLYRLLKLMEEPPPNTTIILVTTRLDRVSVTIRSRCQERQF